jgi:hypothetical protein
LKRGAECTPLVAEMVGEVTSHIEEDSFEGPLAPRGALAAWGLLHRRAHRAVGLVARERASC